jgi:hypothetical protein
MRARSCLPQVSAEEVVCQRQVQHGVVAGGPPESHRQPCWQHEKSRFVSTRWISAMFADLLRPTACRGSLARRMLPTNARYSRFEPSTGSPAVPRLDRRRSHAFSWQVGHAARHWRPGGFPHFQQCHCPSKPPNAQDFLSARCILPPPRNALRQSPPIHRSVAAVLSQRRW